MKQLAKHYSLILTIGVLTVIFGTIYVVGQQILRQDANDPQIQLAQDIAQKLNAGGQPTDIDNSMVNMATSLAPFIIIYDKAGVVVAGSGYLNGNLPTVPLGVLQHSTNAAFNAVTWEPAASVRIASVTVSANNYYVLSGRSLKQVEARESTIMELALFGWLVTVVGIVTVNFCRSMFHPKKA